MRGPDALKWEDQAALPKDRGKVEGFRGMEQLTRAQACSALTKRCEALLEKLKLAYLNS